MEFKDIITILLLISFVIFLILSIISTVSLTSAIKENSIEKKNRGQKFGKLSKPFMYSTTILLIIRVALIFAWFFD